MLRRDVALKILERTAASNAVAVRRFEREAMAASGLQSPHTIRVFDFGASDDGVWFMAMEHLEGVDLSSATGLKQEQVNAAKGSADTKLPLGLCLPKNWTAVGPNTPNACPATK